MNDRTSAAPPADFLGPGRGRGTEANTDYERHFAMDWKPPQLNFGSNGSDGSAYGNVPGNRNSISMSVNSGLSGLTARTNSNNGKAPRPTNGSGFFAQVKERFSLHRSTSNLSVGADVDVDVDVDGDEDADDHATTNNNGSTSSFMMPPVFKHKRSGSASTTNTLRKKNRPDWGLSKKDADDTRSMRSAKTAPPPAFEPVPHVPHVPSFDSTGRPTRDEIAANYQSLLASGFFGTHAIQSTRFSPPGRNLHRQEQEAGSMPSFAQRLVEEDETSQGTRTLPPSPERPPPPPPPNRAAPEPPPAAMETEHSATTSAGIPVSDTVVFNPATSGHTSSQDMDTDTSMSPPPPPPDREPPAVPPANMPPPHTPARKLRPTHKPSLSFSSVPYSSTRPGAEPVMAAQRPYQPPPVSLSRFSFSAGRPRSLDLSQRGTKRPFTATQTNGSQATFQSAADNDYDPMEEDDDGNGIGVATTTDDGGEVNVESGARRLVKRLRKSASKISIDLGRTISRQPSARFSDGGEDVTGSGLEPTPSRTSTSSNLRRTFSWKGLGSHSGGGSASTDPHHLPVSFTTTTTTSTSGGGNFFGGLTSGVGGSCLPLSNTNSSNDHAAASAPVPPAHKATVPPVAIVSVPISGGSSSSAERNRLKKREIRGRRLRRKESVRSSPATPSPLKQPPMMMLLSPSLATVVDDNRVVHTSHSNGNNNNNNNNAMDWQGSPNAKPRSSQRSRSRSRSRPRRSDASIFLHAQSEGDERPQFEYGHNDPEAGGGMEGVEFSFHFPGRTRPGGGGPLAVVPDANRGIPAVPSIPGTFRKGVHSGHGHGSVRLVRSSDVA